MICVKVHCSETWWHGVWKIWMLENPFGMGSIWCLKITRPKETLCLSWRAGLRSQSDSLWTRRQSFPSIGLLIHSRGHNDDLLSDPEFLIRRVWEIDVLWMILVGTVWGSQTGALMTTVFLQIFLLSLCRPILRFFPLPVLSSAIHEIRHWDDRREGWLCLVETSQVAQDYYFTTLRVPKEARSGPVISHAVPMVGLCDSWALLPCLAAYSEIAA